MSDYSFREGAGKLLMRKLITPKNVIVFLIVLFILSLRFFVSIILDWTWFSVLGYASVFWRSFFAKLLVGGGIFAGVAVLNLVNLVIVYKIAKKPFKLIFALPAALLAAVIVAGNSGELWLSILRAFNAVPFGVTDPQFQLDIGFYVFLLPVLWLVYRLVMTWLIVNMIMAGVFYLILLPRNIEITVQNVTTRIFTGVEKKGLLHVGFLLGLTVAWQAVRYKLSIYELLFSQTGSVIGAGAADIGARFPAYYTMMVLSVLVAIYIVLAARKNIRRVLIPLVAFLFISVLVTEAFPGLYQKLIVDPDELGRETPYLERNVAYTRMAYGLDKLTEMEYPVGELTAGDIEENRVIIDNIRLLDYQAAKKTYIQQQEIRPYYSFVDVDVDRYLINGRLTQVFLAARELDQSALPEQAQNFNNLMFKYTHGIGLAMSPANDITETGLPEYLIKDIPPQSALFSVREPRIYYGEKTKSNVIVNTGLPEFDYPVGDDNEEYLYQGGRGIPMTFFNKVLLSIRDMQFKYLLSDYITAESQYLETREITDRVNRIAPFLYYDSDPYLVLGEDGKLYYMLDAYTVSDKYPYSQAVDGSAYNYFRNSVKITVDAYTGEVNFYLFDKEDPVIQVYNKIYPGLLKGAEEMPQHLRQHVRYPEDLFHIQSLMLRDYHMGNTTVFYNREDRWELTQENYSGKQVVQEPYYSIIRFPGEKKEEFILMRAFSPSRKQNMIAWLAARMDGENYGKLTLFKFPKGVQVTGTNQVESLIDQDPTISSQLTLWGQGGSNVIRGNLLVYPIAGSLLYVEPLYIESEQNKYPQLKKVFLFYKDRIVMEDTLKQALLSLFGEARPPSAETGDSGPASLQNSGEDLIRRLITLHRESKEKLKTGNWAEYGRLQEEIDAIISMLEEQQE